MPKALFNKINFSLISGLFALVLFQSYLHADDVIKVYKSPTCGCCSKWITHLEEAGLKTTHENSKIMSHIKDDLKIPVNARSCHTSVVKTTEGKFVFEGHIPATIIQRFLDNPPKNSIGLSVPGMPIGSPGMEVGDKLNYYEVLLLHKDGSSSVFEKVNEKRQSKNK